MAIDPERSGTGFMKYALIFGLLLLFSLPATAATYKWEDSRGVHLTDELSSVPAELRARAVPEDENGVISFGKVLPMRNDTGARQKKQAEIERANEARDRIVNEAIKQHQAEVIRQMSRQSSGLQQYAIQVFSDNKVLWIVPILIVVAIWLTCLTDIMRSSFTTPAGKYLWLAAVMFLPPVTVPLYYIFGRHHKTDNGSDAG